MSRYNVINTPFYIVTVFSLTLLLFVLGWTMTSMVLSSNLIADFKEQINMTAELSEDQNNQQEIIEFLKNDDRVKTESVEFVSKEDALVIMKKELGSGLLGESMENPFQAIVQFAMKAEHLSLANLNALEKDLMTKYNIQGLYYPPDLFSGVQRTFRSIGMYGLIIVGILFMIVALLIHQIIKMNIISNRFAIHTMEMVGALPGTIRKPFRQVALRIGLVGGLLSIILYGLSVLLMPQLQSLTNFSVMSIPFYVICGVLFVLGLTLCLISSRLALARYL